MEVKEVKCKTLMTKSKGGPDYTINPYRGCNHGCVYCYAPYFLREKREWGTFVDVKINAPEILKKEILRNKKGKIMISIVTDPYQAVESRYKITREILHGMSKDFFVSILTKSNLVLRDIDLLKKLNCDVGLTITTVDEDFAKVFEPNAPSPKERLNVLSYLKISGIKTYIFFGPMLPFVSDANLDRTVSKFALAKPDKVYVDRLNIKSHYHWDRIKSVLEAKYPDMVEKWRQVLFTENDYYENLKQRVSEVLKRYDIKYELCY